MDVRCSIESTVNESYSFASMFLYAPNTGQEGDYAGRTEVREREGGAHVPGMNVLAVFGLLLMGRHTFNLSQQSISCCCNRNGTRDRPDESAVKTIVPGDG